MPAGFGNSTDCLPDPNITLRYVYEDLEELGVDQATSQLNTNLALTLRNLLHANLTQP